MPFGAADMPNGAADASHGAADMPRYAADTVFQAFLGAKSAKKNHLVSKK